MYCNLYVCIYVCTCTWWLLHIVKFKFLIIAHPINFQEKSSKKATVKQAHRRDFYAICQENGLGSLAAKFGLTPEQFGENLRDNYQRHETEQHTIEPEEAAEDYVQPTGWAVVISVHPLEANFGSKIWSMMGGRIVWYILSGSKIWGMVLCMLQVYNVHCSCVVNNLLLESEIDILCIFAYHWVL